MFDLILALVLLGERRDEVAESQRIRLRSPKTSDRPMSATLLLRCSDCWESRKVAILTNNHV